MIVKAKSSPRWRRVVFKISGVALASSGNNNIDPKVNLILFNMLNYFGITWLTLLSGEN